MSLGRLSPPFLYSFSLLSKTATSSLFVIHFTEISPSTSEKHRFLQYSSSANHDSQPYSARYIPSFGGAWGGPSPLSFIPLHYYIKRQLPHSLPSISLKYPLQQVKYIALSSTHHQQTTTPNLTPPGTSPPSEGLGEAALPPFLFLLWAWGGRPFIFQIFPSTPPLALKYWKYEHVIFRQNTPFLSFTAAAAASVDRFITFYFLSSLSPNTFFLSSFLCFFFTNFTLSSCFSVFA